MRTRRDSNPQPIVRPLSESGLEPPGHAHERVYILCDRSDSNRCLWFFRPSATSFRYLLSYYHISSPTREGYNLFFFVTFPSYMIVVISVLFHSRTGITILTGRMTGLEPAFDFLSRPGPQPGRKPLPATFSIWVFMGLEPIPCLSRRHMLHIYNNNTI